MRSAGVRCTKIPSTRYRKSYFAEWGAFQRPPGDNMNVVAVTVEGDTDHSVRPFFAADGAAAVLWVLDPSAELIERSD